MPLLEVRGLGKRFPGVVALAGVDLRVDAGEVVAVIGENGAGKSTLMKVVAGVHEPDAGELRWCGEPVRIDSVRRAAELGIALIHQELNLCDNLSVGANVLLGREPGRRLGWLVPRAVDAAARPFLARVGLDVDPRTPLGRLAMGPRQLVEIAKALSQDARLLIMDEPTSSLSFDETERLCRVIDELRAQGCAVLYISHRLGEVERVADRVIGLRDGRPSGALERGAIDHRAMVRLMVGRELEVRPRARRDSGARPVRLAIEGLRSATWPEHAVDLQVHAGEIVGLAGLVGAGRSELLEAVFGAARALAGRVAVDGVALPRGHGVRDAVAAGLAFVPEDRKERGAVLRMSALANTTLASLPEHRRAGGRWAGVLDGGRERATFGRVAARLDLRCKGPGQPVATLSGGNQQKVVLGRWLARDAQVLLLDEPTRGVDIGAKDEIYKRMEELAAQGCAILFASSELAELLALADRIVVMHEGAVAGELRAERATEELVMALATGAGTRAAVEATT
ncbi:MAG: sugar ABC transporter ATP-binding protein [Planctomycetes bacterium]|nr:sugar ABC transporter ATP-binding protein [Planctomycetota bacterium]